MGSEMKTGHQKSSWRGPTLIATIAALTFAYFLMLRFAIRNEPQKAEDKLDNQPVYEEFQNLQPRSHGWGEPAMIFDVPNSAAIRPTTFKLEVRRFLCAVAIFSCVKSKNLADIHEPDLGDTVRQL